MFWEAELEDREEVERERLVQMQPSALGLEAWEKEAEVVWEAELASSLELRLRPV